MGRALDGATVAAAAWRLYRAGRACSGVRPRRHGAQHIARLHRRVELWACGLFWARRLRRRTDIALSGALDAGGDRRRHAAWRTGWHFVRTSDRATPRRLFRDVHDRVWPALVLPRL